MTAMRIRPAAVDSIATCDWGRCDQETVAERFDEASGEWLAVCRRHGERSARPSPGRGDCASCKRSYSLSVEGLVRLHRAGWASCPGSGMQPAGEAS